MPTIVNLPNELLFKIFTNLDRPAAFSLTCRTLHLITKDPHARAAFFLQKHGPRLAIFYAIRNHAKIVTKLTAEAMIASGAIVSRNLAQRLVKDYLERQPSEYFRCCWTSKLTLGTYLVVLNKAYELYGDNLWARDAMDDWEQFRICISLQSGMSFDTSDQTSNTHDTNRECVRELVNKYHVVPLPLQTSFAAISDTFVTIARLGDHQLLRMSLNDLANFDHYEFVNIVPTIVEKLIYNKPTRTHLEKALRNLFNFQSPVLKDLGLELIRNCGMYKNPNVILEVLLDRKNSLPFDLDQVVLRSINDKFHSVYSFNGAPDNIESLWQYFPHFRQKIRDSLATLFQESRSKGGAVCNRNDASYYGYGVGCVAVEFLITQFGPRDPITEMCFDAIIRDICEKDAKLPSQRSTNGFLNPRNGSVITDGVLMHGSPQYFIRYLEAGVKLKPNHLRILCDKGIKRKWFLEEIFTAMENMFAGDSSTVMCDSGQSIRSIDSVNVAPLKPFSRPTETEETNDKITWKEVIEEVLERERENAKSSNKVFRGKGRLYKMLDDLYRRHFR